MSDDVTKWLDVIAAYEREFKQWETRGDTIVKKYRDYDTDSKARRDAPTTFNILWSNVQTCLPATFARLPKPDVSRRFRDNDPVGRVAALILERALEFEIEHYPDYRAAMEQSVLDRFLPGRGIAWVRYEPHFKAAEIGTPEDGLQITEDADEAESSPEAQEVIDYECAPVDYVHWKDFGHTVARTWEEVPAVWRRVYMSRPALVERFGEELGNKIPLDTRPEELSQRAISASDDKYQACIYEIWDKVSNKAIWLSKSWQELLDERDDPLQLEGFFPCPRPLYATTTSETLIPVPDFKLYQDQAKELDVLADRISGLIRALRVRGVYDAAVPELQRLFSEAGDNEMIPVNNWQAFSEKMGLKGAIDLVDIAPIAQALNEAYKAVDQVKNQIYEIMGIADIIRGSTDPNETLGAQKLKGQFGSLRLRAMQSKVGQFAVEILQIKAQIMCRMFQPETLAKLASVDQLNPADQQYIVPALQMLKDEPMRNFRIEVSSDSMIQMDEQQEKQDRLEFLKAVGGFLNQAVPAIEQTPEIAPMLVEMMKFGVTGFKVGKNLEGMFDQTLDQLRQQASQPQQPKPDPEMAKLQAQGQQAAQELQMKTQADNQRMAMEHQQKMEQIAANHQAKMAEIAAGVEAERQKQAFQNEQATAQNQQEAARAELQAHLEAQLDAQRTAADERIAAMQEQTKQLHEQVAILIARLNNEAKIEVAEIAAGATLEAAQITAADAAAREDASGGASGQSEQPKED